MAWLFRNFWISLKLCQLQHLQFQMCASLHYLLRARSSNYTQVPEIRCVRVANDVQVLSGAIFIIGKCIWPVVRGHFCCCQHFDGNEETKLLKKWTPTSDPMMNLSGWRLCVSESCDAGTKSAYQCTAIPDTYWAASLSLSTWITYLDTWTLVFKTLKTYV